MIPRGRFVLLFVCLWTLAFAAIYFFEITDGDSVFLISISVLAITFVLDGFIARYLEKRNEGKGGGE